MASSKINYEEGFITNKRGLKLFTCKWIPEERKPKALLFLLHGYATGCSVSMKGTATRLARAGFGVYGLDCIGHGKSEGLRAFIPSFDDLLLKITHSIILIFVEEGNGKKKRYIMGESMGGVVALLLHRKMPGFWNGVVLVAPMCKIAESVKPSSIVVNILNKLCNVIPTWKIVPGQDVMEVAIRDPQARKQVRANPNWYTGRPRLKTASELLKVSDDLEHRLHEVTLPFIVVHGGADKVTDPNVSKLLYETSASTDKTFNLYDGMWHSLTFGEFPDNIDRVFADVIAWLNERSAMDDETKIEKEKKLIEDKDISIAAPSL